MVISEPTTGRCQIPSIKVLFVSKSDVKNF
jgi:hypothetical protein